MKIINDLLDGVLDDSIYIVDDLLAGVLDDLIYPLVRGEN